MASVVPKSQPSDYILWSYLKDQVNEDNSPTIQKLEENIKREIKKILKNMLERVIKKFNL